MTIALSFGLSFWTAQPSTTSTSPPFSLSLMSEINYPAMPLLTQSTSTLPTSKIAGPSVVSPPPALVTALEPIAGDGPDNYKTIFSIAELGGSDSAAHAQALLEKAERSVAVKSADDIEHNGSDSIERLSDRDIPRDPTNRRLVAVHGLNRPYFHFDLQEAVEAAVANAQRRSTKSIRE